MNRVIAFGTALLIGPIVGSFVTNWALRWARGQSAITGRSCCEHCHVDLGYAQTTPLFSYVALGGRCATCHEAIDPIHPVGEIAGGLILVVALLAPTPTEAALRTFVGFCLLALAIIDLKLQRLFNSLTAMVALGCGAIAFLRGEVEEGLIGAACIVTLMLFLRLVIRRGKTLGMGYGDIKLAAGLCLWIGLASTWMVFAASLIGVAWRILAPSENRKVTYGPSLGCAAFIMCALRDAWSAWS